MARPLLIASLGNPGARFAKTRHSAGHVLLRALARHPSVEFPSFARDARLAGAQAATSGNVTLWESNKYMNESAVGLAPAWRAFVAMHSTEDTPHLVILHDELELRNGRARLRTTAPGASARGHNGLRSVLGASTMRDLRVSRVGVGIGPRPNSRESDVVANFVLADMPKSELERIDGLAVGMWTMLEKLREGGEWKGEFVDC